MAIAWDTEAGRAEVLEALREARRAAILLHAFCVAQKKMGATVRAGSLLAAIDALLREDGE